MKQIPKLLLFGLLTWVVPFVLSFAFFDPQTRSMIIDEIFFKSIMIVTGALIGVGLTVVYFKPLKSKYLFHGVIIGLVWLVINWIFDLLMVWRGFFDMTYLEWFQQIGLRYMSLPIFTIGVGVIVANQKKAVIEKVEDEKEEE